MKKVEILEIMSAFFFDTVLIRVVLTNDGEFDSLSVL